MKFKKIVLLQICFTVAFIFCIADPALADGARKSEMPGPSIDAKMKHKTANPASENCFKNGGYLVVQQTVDGEHGICVFKNNMQCEEWALFNGDCPVGGVNISGPQTPASIYCLISGGMNKQGERGNNCVFKNGTSCNVEDFVHREMPIECSCCQTSAV